MTPSVTLPAPPADRSPIPTEYERIHVLYEISNALARSTDIAQACSAALSLVTRTLSIRTAVLLDATAGLPLAHTWAAEGVEPRALQLAHEHARRALAYLAPEMAASLEVAPHHGALQDNIGGLSDGHFITLPLAAASEVFGVFQIQGAQPFEERDLLLIDAVVDQLAMACERHHARAVLEAARVTSEEAHRRLGHLQVITKAALEGATLDESLTAILDALGNVFGTDTAAVLLASGDGKTFVPRASIGLPHGGGRGLPIDTGVAGRIAATTTAIVLNDVGDLAGLDPALLAADVRSVVGAPLRARSGVMGIVFVGAHDRERFTSDDARLLALVADRIEKVLDHAARYDIALAAIQSRDAVLGTVSHDLRNPLGTIQVWSEVVEADTRHAVKGARVIQRSVELMSRMIGDLLDISSIDAGRLSIRTSAQHADALLAQALEGVRRAATDKKLRIDAPSTSDLIVECDRIRIVQVLTNLLSNAVKFTPEHGTITLAVTAEDGRVQFSIRDTGCGISESDLPHVFDRYWQARAEAHRGRAEAHRGTGLGLAIAKGIVESHGGVLRVESQIGRGTTFSFTLPLVRV